MSSASKSPSAQSAGIAAQTPSSRRLEGRIAIVTGSSSGLGRSIALALSAHGASIFCIDLYPAPRTSVNNNTNTLTPTTSRSTDDMHNRSNEPGTHERIRHLGNEATYYKADITRAREIDLAIRACVSKYKRIDILVNCAGISVESGHARPLRCHETSEEDFDRTMAINTKGMFLGCKYVLKQMLDGQPQVYGSRGWIINVASIQGIVPYYGTPSYCASKGAAVMLTKQIALDYAKDKVHANALCPGFLKTNMTQNLQSQEEVVQEVGRKHPLGGTLGNVDDVARAAVFLASDDAAWVTGVPLAVDGGYSLIA